MLPAAKTSSAITLATLGRSLSRFLGWWRGELAMLVPQGLRLWWRGAGSRLVMTVAEDQAVISRPAAGRLEQLLAVPVANGASPLTASVRQQLGRLAGTGFRLFVAIPTESVLRRTLTLPLAVEENLRQTLAFELDRYTPFKPDQVHFDFRIRDRDPVQRRLNVELAVVPRATIDQKTSLATALGLPVAGALPADQATADDSFNFLPAATTATGSSSTVWWRSGLAALAILLLAVLLAVPIWQKRAAAISLLAPLEQAKAEARVADTLRDRLDQLVKDYSQLIDMKWAAPSLVLVLEELSKRLPDDTFITQMDFDGKTAQIQGESASAASLVEQLENSPMFKDVGFKAQLTKIQGTQNDRFHIAAVLEADAQPKPIPDSGNTAAVAGPVTEAQAPAAHAEPPPAAAAPVAPPPPAAAQPSAAAARQSLSFEQAMKRKPQPAAEGKPSAGAQP
jgi:general secretion pathway protein L